MKNAKLKKLIKHYPPVVFLKMLKNGLTTADEKIGINALLNNTPLPVRNK
jgi:hypothetical protein